MADELYARLGCCDAGAGNALFSGLLDNNRPARRPKKAGACEHEKPKFANGRERQFCFVCWPKEVSSPQERVDRTADARQCVARGCKQVFSSSARSSRQYCSDPCRNAVNNARAASGAEHICEGCAQAFRTHKRNTRDTKWCSHECKPKALRGLFSCQHCGIEFKKKKSAPGEREKYCSRQCRFAALSKRKSTRLASMPPKEPKPNALSISAWFAGYCRRCGDAGGGQRRWSYCGTCAAKQTREAAEQAHNRRAFVTSCADCSVEYCVMYGGMRMPRCLDCAKQAERSWKQAAKDVRKAIKRGAAGGRAVHWRVICERDGWACQMCGIETPEGLRGTFHSQAPEIDHLVAVALGGTHEAANLACLCRRCNQLKSDLPLDEAIEVIAKLLELQPS